MSSSSGSRDRRQHLRVPLADVLAGTLGLTAPVRVVDISLTGVRIAHAHPLTPEAYERIQALRREVYDSEALYRWTDGAAGYSTPILFGTRSFTGGSRRVLPGRTQEYVFPCLVPLVY